MSTINTKDVAGKYLTVANETERLNLPAELCIAGTMVTIAATGKTYKKTLAGWEEQPDQNQIDAIKTKTDAYDAYTESITKLYNEVSNLKAGLESATKASGNITVQLVRAA